VLTGDRVVLRPLRPSDVEPLWRTRLDPVTWAQTTEAPLVPETLEEAQARYAGPSAAGTAQFAVEVDGVLAGRAGLFGVDELARHGEVGLTLLPEHRGQGLGQDVLRVLLGYAFRSRNLRRVRLQSLASNERALGAYRAVGFAEEGRLREHAWVEGAYEDIVLLAVLRADWAAAQTSSPSR
jgi:RimJ/RimL family protein N-acetyltransferase